MKKAILITFTNGEKYTADIYKVATLRADYYKQQDEFRGLSENQLEENHSRDINIGVQNPDFLLNWLHWYAKYETVKNILVAVPPEIISHEIDWPKAKRQLI